MNLSQAELAPKQLNLNKLSDAGGSQIQWLPTSSKTDFSGCLGITFACLLLLSLSSCEKYYVTVSQQWVDVRYLASTHVKTPDPRQDHPPIGQMMIMDWRVPKDLLPKKPHIQLTMIFWNYTEKTVCFPIDQRMGWVTYKLLNEEYDATGGILTYKAEIVDENGTLFREWKHQLWVNLITIKEEAQLPMDDEKEEESIPSA